MFLEIIIDQESTYWLLFTWYRQSKITEMMSWATFGMLNHSVSNKFINDYQNHAEVYFSDFQYFLKNYHQQGNSFWLLLTWYSQTKIT